MKKISIMLAEDHTMFRECIQMLLKLEPDIEVVGEARNGRDIVRLVPELMPDVILMDISMPQLNGLEATRQILKAVPTSRIIILSGNCEDGAVKGAVDAGALGFLLKQDCSSDLCEAIRHVSRGGIHYSPAIAKRFIRMNPKSLSKSGKMERKSETLTAREMEVLQLVAEGSTNKEIAVELCISIKTVEKHRGQLMRKLDIHDTAGLTRHAIASGIIECSVRQYS